LEEAIDDILALIADSSVKTLAWRSLEAFHTWVASSGHYCTLRNGDSAEEWLARFVTYRLVVIYLWGAFRYVMIEKSMNDVRGTE
jgi:heme-degrading monooxygenase HmoA